MELEVGRILGLPAHPLLAHAPVVLVPLTAVAAVLGALSRRWRERLGWTIVALAVVTVASVQLAIGSGEELEESVRRSPLVRAHAGVADTLLPLSALVLLAVTATTVLDARRRRPGRPPGRSPALVALAAVTVLAAALSTAWAVRAGHSGARAVWDDPARPMLRPGGAAEE